MPNFYSIIPPLAAIIGAAVTKRIIPSLVLGLLAGTLLQSGGSLLGSVLLAGQALAGVVSEESHAYIILFLFSFGALAEIFKVGGGISGFAKLTEPYIKTERGALLSVLWASPVTFLDCCFHTIATGAISKPLLEKVDGSKDKLALIVNTTSSQLIALIPFATTYVGYILGVIGSSMAQVGLTGNPYRIYLSAIALNFYSISMLGVSCLAIFFPFQLSWLKLAQPAYKPEADTGDHDSHEAHDEHHYQEKVPPRVTNLLLPLLFLLALIMYLLWWTGQAKGAASVGEALLNADYEKAIFVATLATLVSTTLLYALQKIPMKELQSHFLSGGTEMLPPIVILTLAWALTGITQQLGFSPFIGSLLGNTLPPQLVPVIVFALGGLASYFMGSSWGTWALIMPLALSLAVTTGANVPLVVGAVLAGGSIGDNLSPLGETPVLTAAVMDIPVTSHISYVLPYGLVAIGTATLLYLALGYALL